MFPLVSPHPAPVLSLERVQEWRHMSSPPEDKGSQTTEHGTSLGGPPMAFTFFFLTWFLDWEVELKRGNKQNQTIPPVNYPYQAMENTRREGALCEEMEICVGVRRPRCGLQLRPRLVVTSEDWALPGFEYDLQTRAGPPVTLVETVHSGHFGEWGGTRDLPWVQCCAQPSPNGDRGVTGVGCDLLSILHQCAPGTLWPSHTSPRPTSV